MINLQPTLAWTVILGFAFLSIICILAGLGQILNLAFPLGAFLVGIFLYLRYPILYLGFTWWLWFLTPLVRRLSDYYGKFTEPSPILLAPFLVTFVTVLTLVKYIPKSQSKEAVPYFLSMTAVLYALLIGLLNFSVVKVGITFLDWIVPILFGFHLFVNWSNYLAYRQNIQRVFLWGVLIMGIYGTIQFLIAPEWDVYWLVESGFSSGGQPKPLMINVWSTMASNRPFGTIMMAGLLLLFVNEKKGIISLPTTSFGYLAFFLTKKRTTWISWLFGLLVMTSSLKPKIQMRVISTLLITVLCVLPLVTLEPFSEVIGARVETLSNLEEDNSAEARTETYAAALDQAATSFIGSGLGVPSFDSGILSSALGLGWVGSMFYFGGMFIFVVKLYEDDPNISNDAFFSAARAITITTFIQIPLGSPHIEVQGMILWSFLSLGLASKKYYAYNQNSAYFINSQKSRNT